MNARQPPAGTPADTGLAAPAAAHEDGLADLQARVKRLVESPSYRQADEDAAFLQRPEMCGVRLQLDFWKTEEILQRRRINHTVVVYGSTRLVEPGKARQRLDGAHRAEAFPDDRECARACSGRAFVRQERVLSRGTRTG
jgi:hypothetical protein